VSSKPWSSSSIQQRVDEAIGAISAISSHIRRYTAETFAADRKTLSAVERELSIISEAIAKLIQLEAAAELPAHQRFESRFPEINVYEIRGFGNVLRHGYGSIDPRRVWGTITGPDLPDLKAALEKYRPFGGTSLVTRSAGLRWG
jgi:uncharacterized protein with HEPN domain